MASAQPLESLQKSSLSQGLSEAEVRSLLELCGERSISRGEFLFREGDPGDALYVVVEGDVEVLKRDAGGTDRQLAKIGPGAILGEMSLIAGESSARTASARALSDVRALVLKSREFQARLKANDLAALKVVHNFAQVMSRRLLQMNQQIADALATAHVKSTGELSKFNQLLSDWSF
ncbi:MAG: Crp/Fnr family transcriptional regulator [Myxococcales bacterium]